MRVVMLYVPAPGSNGSFKKSDAGPAGAGVPGAAVLLFLATGAFLGSLLRAALFGGFLRGLLRGFPGTALLRRLLRRLLGGLLHRFPGCLLRRRFLGGLLLRRLFGSRFGGGRGRCGGRWRGFFGDAPRERCFVAHRMLLRMDR